VSSLNFNIPNFVDNRGIEYRFQVLTDPSDNIAPLRSVRAIEVSTERVALEGERSFSSSVDVLVEELKFRIIEELN